MRARWLGVGAALGGVALAIDTPAAYVAAMALDAAGFVTAGLALHRLPRVAPVPMPRDARWTVLRDRPVATVALINAASCAIRLAPFAFCAAPECCCSRPV